MTKQTALKIFTLVLIVVVVGTLAGCTRDKTAPTAVPTAKLTGTPAATAARTGSATPASGTASSASVSGSPTPVPSAGPTSATSPTPVPPVVPTVVATPTSVPVTVPTTAAPAPGAGSSYTVKAGDTLSGIATQFGTTTAAIKQANNLTSDDIKAGQVLTIPGGATTPGVAGTYVVTLNDTLFSIATRFGTTVAAIKQANNLTSDTIYVGQKLTISGAGTTTPSGPTVHVVALNETLWSIALRYGVTVEAIKAANGLGSDAIYAGQRLTIPGAGQPSAPAQERYHVVAAGESLMSIALRYGVTVDAVVKANNLPNPNFIWVGQRLRIP